MHRFYEGKMQVIPKCVIRSVDDFAIWYTPGVAAACKEIQANPDKSFELTNRWNYVAVVTDGTRVLGLGNIGPEAAMPVMEGKALIFKYLGGVDAFPICLRTKDPNEIVKICKTLEPTFGGINLEDIEKPKCFQVLEQARSEMQIPVWHDDQQGTATVILAGLINSFKLVGKKPKESLITLVGSGAANLRTAYVLIKWGVKPGNIILADSKGVVHKNRKDIIKNEDPWKYELTQKTNSENRTGTIQEAFKGVDAVVAASQPGPDTIKKEWIKSMADNSIVFACANPIPEIWPWEAEEAGAKIVATGRSDFANQVNNSLGFPAIFRGVLDVKAKTITDDMCIAAATELANYAEERGMNEKDILPRMDEWEVFPREAVACALKSIEQGVARIKPSRQELYDRASTIISNARQSTELLMKHGLIKQAPKEKDLLK
ncbi:MAG: NADP-dependent malic enzyme [Candidatus Bathyarchaeota archaeon]|nr:NADP-dependent malic enzyme [Candidatus Bathyarchaeota archaeon]MDI9577750.1 NADP-dependent malic enzyme [Thermoproteota archaeon]MDT8782929.1 NADP-dependent malic enzyme [Candidatus Bathyarchaeota archaeon]NLD66056.1 NADP-dependent malic enzyme [Thermoproteota archaeon]